MVIFVLENVLGVQKSMENMKLQHHMVLAGGD